MYREALVLIGCFALIGCRTAGHRYCPRAESFKKEIVQEPLPESPEQESSGWCSPQPLLRHIPVGTPVEEAEAILRANGFECSHDKDSDGKPQLVAVAHREFPPGHGRRACCCLLVGCLTFGAVVPPRWKECLDECFVDVKVTVFLTHEGGRVTGATIRVGLTGL